MKPCKHHTHSGHSTYPNNCTTTRHNNIQTRGSPPTCLYVCIQLYVIVPNYSTVDGIHTVIRTAAQNIDNFQSS